MYTNPTNTNTLASRRKWPEASTALWRGKKEDPPPADVRGEVEPGTSAPSVEQSSGTSPGQDPPGKTKKTSEASKEAFLADTLEATPSDRAPCPVNLASVLADRGLALVEPDGV